MTLGERACGEGAGTRCKGEEEDELHFSSKRSEWRQELPGDAMRWGMCSAVFQASQMWFQNMSTCNMINMVFQCVSVV